MNYEPMIDPMDPLLSAFTWQHDLRERFLRALEQIIAVDQTSSDAAAQCRHIAEEAIDDDKIREWDEAKRPIPWLDEVVGEQAEKLRQGVIEQLQLTPDQPD